MLASLFLLSVVVGIAEGLRVEDNQCATSPCKNGGTCLSSGSMYTCKCRIYFNGTNCEINNMCAPSRCKNGGRCAPTGSSYTCNCPKPFVGQNCENKLEETGCYGYCSGCFPGTSLVMTPSGHQIAMSELSVGDRVLTVDVATGQTQFSDVVAFADRDVNATSLFVELHTETGYKMTLTPTHLLYVSDTTSATDAQMIFADKVRIGQFVFTVSKLTWLDDRTSEEVKADQVTSVTTVVRQAGIYNPLTTSGTIVVDGIMASCYGRFGSHPLADLAMTPLKICYLIKEFLDVHWFDSAMRCEGDSHCYVSAVKQLAGYVFPESWWF